LSVVDRIYFDSSVLIKWLTGSGFKTQGRAQAFIEGVCDGKYEGVVSLVTLMEVVKVLRVLYIEKGKYDPSFWNAKTDEAIDKINKLPKMKIVSGTVSETGKSYTRTTCDEMSFGQFTDESLKLLKKYPGNVKQNKAGTKYEHDGISVVDALHIVIAKKYDCNKIVSFDGDFNTTASEIKPIVIESN